MADCARPACPEPVFSRGLCRSHYQRQYRADQAVLIGAAHRRHAHAMKVVATLPEEDDRWSLLDYVVRGSERLDVVFSQAA